jgi:O-antigen/teichoic acid export membrane protein
VDTYIRKEVATRPDHASEFYGGFLVLRLLLALVIFAIMALWLGLGHRPALIWHLVFLFGLGRIAYVDNNTSTALLQAADRFNEVAWMNVAAKIVWGLGIGVGLYFGQATRWVACSFVVSETLKSLYLLWVVHAKLHLSWTVQRQATWSVVRKSFPYFLNNIALQIYAYVNIILLEYWSNNKEVGWYGATMTLASFAGMFVPVMQAVVMPMAARLAKRSEAEMDELMRSTARLVIVMVTPLALVFMLHADTVAYLAFGSLYGPAAESLRIIAPMFPLTYLATVLALHLIQQGRNWTLTRISLFNVALNPLLNTPLIIWGVASGIPGRAGAMSALATTITEVLTVGINMWLLGKAAVNRQLWTTLGLTALISGAVVLLHQLTPALGIWRMGLESVAYLSLAAMLGTLPVGELRRMWQQSRSARQSDR